VRSNTVLTVSTPSSTATMRLELFTLLLLSNSAFALPIHRRDTVDKHPPKIDPNLANGLRALEQGYKNAANLIQKGAGSVGNSINSGLSELGSAVSDGFDLWKDGLDNLADKSSDAWSHLEDATTKENSGNGTQSIL